MTRVRAGICAALLIVGTTGAVQAGMASGTPSHPVCGPGAAHTITADSVARVYATGQTVYGCAAGAQHVHRLGTRSYCVDAAKVGPVVLARRIAAYGLERCGVDTGATQVVVRRLSDGRRLRSAAATGPSGAESYQQVDSLVVNSDGAVAWIGSGASIAGHAAGVTEVYKADASGAVVRLDSGRAISGGSLRLHSSRLSWRHGRSLRHASLH